MNWKEITTNQEVDQALEESKEKTVLFFKHSVTCGISNAAKFELDENWTLPEEEISTYYLNLLSYREVSNYLAEVTGVMHQSPQVIVVKDKKVLTTLTHYAIKVDKIKSKLTI